MCLWRWSYSLYSSTLLRYLLLHLRCTLAPSGCLLSVLLCSRWVAVFFAAFVCSRSGSSLPSVYPCATPVGSYFGIPGVAMIGMGHIRMLRRSRLDGGLCLSRPRHPSSSFALALHPCNGARRPRGGNPTKFQKKFSQPSSFGKKADEKERGPATTTTATPYLNPITTTSAPRIRSLQTTDSACWRRVPWLASRSGRCLARQSFASSGISILFWIS